MLFRIYNNKNSALNDAVVEIANCDAPYTFFKESIGKRIAINTNAGKYRLSETTGFMMDFQKEGIEYIIRTRSGSEYTFVEIF